MAEQKSEIGAEDHSHPGPTVLVIFGAAGDLTWRKLTPALYNLHLDRWLPEHFEVIGVDRVEMSEDALRQRLRDGVDRHAIRRIPEEAVHQFAVRGQYGAGWLQGQKVPAYRAEPGVASDSFTETYAALRLYVDNWRWQDVPFYLRTGKRLPERVSEISIQFRPVPHQSFPPSAVSDWQPNRLIIRIQPDEGIMLRFQAKLPGPTLRLSPVQMHFSYRETFKAGPPEAYETLLLDVMRGDATLFMRADQVDAAWSVLTPVLNVWDTVPLDFPNYPAGAWGPEQAAALVVPDGGAWLTPALSAETQMEEEKAAS